MLNTNWRPAILLCSLLATSALAGEWKNLGPGGGGWVPSLAVSPIDSRTVFAGCDVGGFYRSEDEGQHWTIRNTGLRDYYVEVILPHPADRKLLYAGTEGGIHRSKDGGDTWELLTNGFPDRQRWSYSAPVGALAFDARDPRTLYAGIGRPRWNKDGKGAIYRSTDGGDHWQLANPNGGGMHPQAIVRSIISRPETGVLFAATNQGLYRSTDKAASWKKIGQDLPADTLGRVALSRSQPDTLYVSILSPAGQTPRRGGVYRSDDGGQTWHACNAGLGNRVGKPGEADQMTSNVDHLAIHPDNPDIVYAGDTSWVTAGLYRSTDGGQNWTKTTQGVDRGWLTGWGESVFGLAMDPQKPDTLYFSTSGHVYATEDRGRSWQQRYTRRIATHAWSGTGLETTCLNRIIIHPTEPDHLYFCYMDVGLIQSWDGGKSFTPTNDGMRHKGNTFTVAFDPEDPKVVYAGTGEWGSNHGDVCKSEDGGLSWRVVGNPDSGLPDGQTYHLVVDPASQRLFRRIYVSVADAGLYCSEDAGATWQPRNDGLPSKAIRGIALQKDAVVVLLGDGNGVYTSTDHGQSWTRMGAQSWPDPKSLAISASDPNRMYVAARDKGWPDGRFIPGGVFASADGGKTWTHVLKDPFMQTVAVDPTNPDILYAGGNDHPFHDDALGSGVQRSRDGGKTWHSLNDESLTVRKISAMTLDPHHRNRLYVGTGGNGVFVRDVKP